jgi:hypothetical protein
MLYALFRQKKRKAILRKFRNIKSILDILMAIIVPRILSHRYEAIYKFMVKTLRKDILRLNVKVFYKKSASEIYSLNALIPGLKYDKTPPL